MLNKITWIIAKITLLCIFLSSLWCVFFYGPSYDSGIITGGEVKRLNGEDTYYIFTKYPDDPFGNDIMVYQNKDTRFGFPFYFKFDSSNIQADASSLVGKLVEVKYYGVRFEITSDFRNILEIREIKNMDEMRNEYVKYVLFLLMIILFIFTNRKLNKLYQ